MTAQTVFRRYELKYLLTQRQVDAVMQAMQPHMQPDPYGQTTLRNIYYDTPNYRIIRASLEKPVYKEKLRLRSYRPAQGEDTVFAELKKKYKGVVYKRRLPMAYGPALQWLSGGAFPGEKPQIAREIDYFLSFYRELAPSMFLSYDRQAFFAADGSGFRVTFDTNILARREEICLGAPVYGAPILPEGKVLMELKCPGAMPLWMAHALCREGLVKTPFSKYGQAYRRFIYPKYQEVAQNVQYLPRSV